MAKPKLKERYLVELRFATYTQVQADYARDTMKRILADIDPALWFGREEEDREQKVRYVFRTRAVGEKVKLALDEECSKFTDSRNVWLYRHWVQMPDRNQLALFTDAGLCACVAPGDSLSWMHCQMIKGRETIGYFNNHGQPISKQLGHLQRILFHGRSVDVWRARRRFRYELNNRQSDHYGDIDYALSKARERLSDASAIHVVNAMGDVYTITRWQVKASEFSNLYDRGGQWVFEFESRSLDVSHAEVAGAEKFDTEFEAELAYATTKQRGKRIGQGFRGR